MECKTCKYWHPGDEKNGSCRFTAPTINGSLFRHNEEIWDGGGVWPWTFDTDWCGEYREFDKAYWPKDIVTVKNLSKACLSISARNTIKKAGFVYLSQITEQSLMAIKQIKAATVAEIMVWKRSNEHLGNRPSD